MATARTPMSLTGGLFIVPPVRRADLPKPQNPFVVTQKLSSHEPPGGTLCRSL